MTAGGSAVVAKSGAAAAAATGLGRSVSDMVGKIRLFARLVK